MMIISNTEITSKNTCDKQHDYMYNQEIEPRKYPLHIQRGTIGHEVLAQYYSYLKDNLNHTAARDFAQDHFVLLVTQSDPNDTERTIMLGELWTTLMQYFDFYQDDSTKYKILDVEQLITAEIGPDITFGLYADVIVEHLTGQYRGSVDIWDHKFVTNFKSPEDLRLDAQQPKYIKAAQLSGLPVRAVEFNQIRHRKMKNPSPSDLFRRAPLLSSKTMIENIWKEAGETATDIYLDKIADTQFLSTRRTLSYSACKFCFFKDLCMAELGEEPTEIMRQVQYQKRKRPLKDWMLTNG